MRTAILALIALPFAQAWAGQCISLAQREEVLRKVKIATVRLDIADAEGSGFLLKSNRGTELVTAHHVVDQRNVSGDGCNPGPSKSVGLKVPMIRFAKGQPRDTVKINFDTLPENFSGKNDLIKTKMDGLPYQALEAEHLRRLPAIDEEIIVSGHPLEKDDEYRQQKCKFIGYGDGSTSGQASAYSLRCADVDYDLAGMSGGVAISACTGKVIGALSTQDYAGECDKRGDKTFVSIAPLSQDDNGEIKFGLPVATGPTVCWYEGTNGRTDIQRACDVRPNEFPPLLPANPPTHSAAPAVSNISK